MVSVLVLIGCHFSRDHPHDPARCSVNCSPLHCYQGRCVSPDAGVDGIIAHDFATPDASPDVADLMPPALDTIAVDFPDLAPMTFDTMLDLIAADLTIDQSIPADAKLDLTSDGVVELGAPDIFVAPDSAIFCGNSTKDGNDQCDGQDFGTSTCQSQGFDGGDLQCTGACKLDTSSCFRCGDSTINGGEACDGPDLAGESCVSQGHAGGVLVCTEQCTLDISRCLGRLISVTAGTFEMGSPPTEPCRDANETQHSVTLTHDFGILVAEVTQGEFAGLMGYNPATAPLCGQDCPVENVSWFEAAAYCNALSANEGLTPCYSCAGSGSSITCSVAGSYAGANIYNCPGYRLPTEAEWEYAYRSGSTTALYNGELTTCQSLEPTANAIAWYANNSSGASHVAAGKVENSWGLFDMAGNVHEWCHDHWAEDLGSASQTNPAPNSGTSRVIRGGSFGSSGGSLRAAARFQTPPDSTGKSGEIGFRICRSF